MVQQDGSPWCGRAGRRRARDRRAGSRSRGYTRAWRDCARGGRARDCRAALAKLLIRPSNGQRSTPFSHRKHHRRACRCEASSGRVHNGPATITLVWPCWASPCSGPPCSALPCSGPALELEWELEWAPEWAPEWARASGWTKTRTKRTRIPVSWPRGIEPSGCALACVHARALRDAGACNTTCAFSTMRA